jgi:predicted transcriptional regulator
MEILQAIIDTSNAFPVTKWANIPHTSTGMYTKCAAILRTNGLIKKHDGYYSLTRDLIYVLDKVQDRWKELVNAVERAEKIRVK